MCLNASQPKHAFGFNQSGQSERLLRDWEEMGPNGIRLWPGHACLQPRHSILLCDCDHSRRARLMAGNKYEGLDWATHTLNTHINVKGNLEADSDTVKHARTHTRTHRGVLCNIRPYIHNINKAFYPVKPPSLSICGCLCVCSPPTNVMPQGCIFGPPWPGPQPKA